MRALFSSPISCHSLARGNDAPVPSLPHQLPPALSSNPKTAAYSQNLRVSVKAPFIRLVPFHYLNRPASPALPFFTDTQSAQYSRTAIGGDAFCLTHNPILSYTHAISKLALLTSAQWWILRSARSSILRRWPGLKCSSLSCNFPINAYYPEGHGKLQLSMMTTLGCHGV